MLKKVVIHLKNDFKKKKNFRPRKKNLFYGPDRPLFCPFAEFFFTENYCKISHFSGKFFSEKNASDFQAFFRSFRQKKKNKKNYPTERPLFSLFGICSPVEQGFFSWPYLFLFILFFCISIFGMPTKLQ